MQSLASRRIVLSCCLLWAWPAAARLSRRLRGALGSPSCNSGMTGGSARIAAVVMRPGRIRQTRSPAFSAVAASAPDRAVRVFRSPTSTTSTRTSLSSFLGAGGVAGPGGRSCGGATR